jgi:hypothetical protein
MSTIIRLWDRSRRTTDWKCPRARYWNYEFKGRGITKSTTSYELFVGIVMHDALGMIATLTKEGKPVPIDSIAEAAGAAIYESLVKDGEDYANEQACLMSGMVLGLFKHIWSRIVTPETKILLVEQELNLKLGDSQIFMAKPDLVTELEGIVTYWEYKTTKSKKDEWISSWDTAVQLHSTVKAIKEVAGISVDQVVVQGIYKGYESYGKQSSPFCYAYKLNGNPPFTRDQILYEYKPGSRRIPVWDLPGGVQKWVSDMPENVLANQFPQTPPIFVNDELLEKFFKQASKREQEISEGVDCYGISDEEMLDSYFPQRFDQCKPAYGRECEFRRICHGEVQDPLSEGFTWREPHHELELETFRQEDQNARQQTSPD